MKRLITTDGYTDTASELQNKLYGYLLRIYEKYDEYDESDVNCIFNATCNQMLQNARIDRMIRRLRKKEMQRRQRQQKRKKAH